MKKLSSGYQYGLSIHFLNTLYQTNSKFYTALTIDIIILIWQDSYNDVDHVSRLDEPKMHNIIFLLLWL